MPKKINKGSTSKVLKSSFFENPFNIRKLEQENYAHNKSRNRVDWSKIAFGIAGLFITLSGAIWYLGQSLAERPTMNEVYAIMQKHENNIENVRTEQILQRRTIDKLEYTLQDVSDGLKEIKQDVKQIKKYHTDY